MKPKPIGIAGGAGSLAGDYLLERSLTLSGTVYSCYKNSDFPQVTLNSYPFSDMLGVNIDFDQIRKELSECLAKLRKDGASILSTELSLFTNHLAIQNKLIIDPLEVIATKILEKAFHIELPKTVK